MEASSEFVFIGNQFAADFVNTRKNIKGIRTELLNSWEDLMRWLEQIGKRRVITGDEDQLSSEERHGLLRRILDLRDTLEEAFIAVAADQHVPPALIAVLNEELARYRSYYQLEATETGMAAVRQYEFSQLPALFLEEAVLFLASFKPDNLKKCENPACILYFYDTSRNQQRRWCSMDRCGNRAKVNQHYHRRKAEHGS